MDSDIEQLVDEALKEVEYLYNSGIMKIDNYRKCLVGLAYEYAHMQKIASCLDLLRKCGPEYFEATFKQQMEEDPLFYKVGEGLKGQLLKFNIIELNFIFMSKPGNA